MRNIICINNIRKKVVICYVVSLFLIEYNMIIFRSFRSLNFRNKLNFFRFFYRKDICFFFFDATYKMHGLNLKGRFSELDFDKKIFFKFVSKISHKYGGLYFFNFLPSYVLMIHNNSILKVNDDIFLKGFLLNFWFLLFDIELHIIFKNIKINDCFLSLKEYEGKLLNMGFFGCFIDNYYFSCLFFFEYMYFYGFVMFFVISFNFFVFIFNIFYILCFIFFNFLLRDNDNFKSTIKKT